MRGAGFSAAVTLALLTVSGAAAAQERPAIFPTRDVDITYRMVQADAPGGARLLEQRMRYAVAARKLRVDPPSPGLYVIVDYATHHLETIREAERMVMETDAPGAMPGGAPSSGASSSGAFKRHGVAEVAGLRCTEWETKDASGEPTLACLTDDGVLLRAVGGGRVLLEAAKVTYGTIDPAAFRIPDGFSRLTPPPLSRAAPLPPAPPAQPNP